MRFLSSLVYVAIACSSFCRLLWLCVNRFQPRAAFSCVCMFGETLERFFMFLFVCCCFLCCSVSCLFGLKSKHSFIKHITDTVIVFKKIFFKRKYWLDNAKRSNLFPTLPSCNLQCLYWLYRYLRGHFQYWAQRHPSNTCDHVLLSYFQRHDNSRILSQTQTWDQRTPVVLPSK